MTDAAYDPTAEDDQDDDAADAADTGAQPDGSAPPPAGAPAAGAAALTGSPSAMDQALARTQQIRDAAKAALASDPTYQAYAKRSGDVDAQRAALASDMDANAAARREIMANPVGPAPAPPTPIEMPAAPTKAQEAEEAHVSPEEFGDHLRAFGQIAPMLAILGGLATRTPIIASLQAATAAINAAKNNDDKGAAAAQEKWKENTQVAIEKSRQQTEQFNQILNNRTLSIQDRMSRLQELAAADGNDVMRAQLATGSLDSLYKMMQMQEAAANKAASAVIGVENAGTKSALAGAQIQNMSVKQQQAQARIMLKQMQIEQDAGKRTINQTIAPIVDKIAKSPNGMADLTTGERQAFDQYMKMAKSGGSGGLADLMAQQAAARAAAAAGTPAAAPGAVPGTAPVVAAPAPAAATSAGAPPPAPAAAARVVGKAYSTPNGVGVWTGSAWKRVPAGA